MGTESTYTLYAIWQINTNTLSFNSNNGIGTMANVSVVSFDTVNLPTNAFTRAGYTFKGWSTTPDGEVEFANGAEYAMGTESSYTLYAVWKADVYTITYNDGESKTVVDFTIEDLPLTLSDLPNKTNYLFDGWYMESDFSGSIITKITELENIELYAKYVQGTDGLKFTNNSGRWSITGYTGASTEVVIPSYYKGKAVTSIASSAFKNCTSLTSVVIPDSITSIGNYAFVNCTSLTSVVIPDSVTIIGSAAFSGCSSLETLTIPFVGVSASATSASSSTLFGYIFGTSSYTGGVSTIQYYSSDSSTYYIPSSLKSVTVTGGNILYGAFENCTSLTSVEIPDSVTSIGYGAFYGCTSLTSVVIPDSITSIGTIAFEDCTSLTSVVIPDSVTSIGSSAFENCFSLTSVVIGDSVRSIGYGVFDGCKSLTSVVIGNSVTSIDSYAFDGCKSLTSVVIPDSVTYIDYYAFVNCTSLTSVEIPDSVTSIGYGAFSGCTSLTSVTFKNPNGWWRSSSSSAISGTSIRSSDLSNTSTAAEYLRSTYRNYYWKRS